MKATTRFYIDAFLQNIKNTAFFLYLPVLIAKLGATPFQISLSNSLPPLFCAVSLAFVTRQLPLNRRVYYVAGFLRQLVFLAMAFCPLLPHPITWLLFFWAWNAVFVMINSVQQPAILRRNIPESEVPKLFSHLKIIAILVTVVGSFTIGVFLDDFGRIFPYNYTLSMVVGAVSTFTGMNLIARMAPTEDGNYRPHWTLPLRRFSPLLMAMFIASMAISVMGPVWTIYHVNILHLTNLQIGMFGILSGLLSTVLMPWMRRGIERYGTQNVIFWMCLGMAVIPFFYTVIHTFVYVLILQLFLGIAFSYFDLAQQTQAVLEAKKQPDELAFLSDYQLVQNVGNGVAPLLAAGIVGTYHITSVFIVLATFRLLCAGGIGLCFKAIRSRPVYPGGNSQMSVGR